jgi:hypothetical protein
MCNKFEKGLGVILRNLWNHVETLQTTDMAALINHIADVFEGAAQNTDEITAYAKQNDLHQRQEVMVFYYLASILKEIEQIGETR